MRTTHRNEPRAFTLIEVLIVVVILGLLAAIVSISFRDAVTNTRQSAFVTDLHNFSAAAEYYVADTGQPVAGRSSGRLTRRRRGTQAATQPGCRGRNRPA